ncbi:10666_t:CDS:1, partial [Scutellospora calospora]
IGKFKNSLNDQDQKQEQEQYMKNSNIAKVYVQTQLSKQHNSLNICSKQINAIP